jgi:hypothetical protein
MVRRRCKRKEREMNSILKAALTTVILVLLPAISLLGAFGRTFYLATVPVALTLGLIFLGAFFHRSVSEFRTYLLIPLCAIFLIFVGVVFFSVSIGDWYVLPFKIMPGGGGQPLLEKFESARSSIDSYLTGQVGHKGVTGHYILSAREAMTNEGFKAAVRNKWDNMDSLSGAIIDTAFIAVPWLIVSVASSLFSARLNPVAVYFTWWSLVSLGLFGLGVWVARR